MANEIVAVSTHPCNSDLPCSNDHDPCTHQVGAIAYLIHTALQTYDEGKPEDRCPLYHETLRLAAGLSIAAIVQEESGLTAYREPFAAFLAYREFTKEREHWRTLAEALGELIVLGMKALSKIGFPDYHRDFLTAVVQSTMPLTTASAQSKQRVRRMIVEVLFKK